MPPRIRRKSAARCASLAFLGIWISTPAHAGWLSSFGLQWANHGFAPETTSSDQSSANHFGVGPALSLGYSLANVFDTAVFVRYTPSNFGETAFLSGEATYAYYGGEVAFRIAKVFYLGFRGGQVSYELATQTDPLEVLGEWQGSGSSFSIGTLIMFNKTSGLQVALDVGTADMKTADTSQAVQNRRLDWIGLTVSATYMSSDSLSRHFGNLMPGWL